MAFFSCAALAEAPPSGMSKNGYFFQEMGESVSLKHTDDLFLCKLVLNDFKSGKQNEGSVHLSCSCK